MTDQQDTHLDSTDQQTPHAPAPQHRHVLMRFLIFCTFIIACAALALGAYLYQQNITHQADRNATQKQLLAAEQKTTEINAQLKNQLNAQAQALKNMTHSQALHQQSEKEEGLFLVRMAHWQWVLSHNRSLTLSLLTAAHHQLSQLPPADINASLLNALNQDIQGIKNEPVDHSDSIAQSIQNMINTLNAIDVKPQHIQPGQHTKTDTHHSTQTTETTETTHENWWGKFKGGLVRLKDYVRVEHTAQPTEPYLSIAAQQALISHVLLQLSQAQWALYNHNNSTYHHSLTMAATLWERFPEHNKYPQIAKTFTTRAKDIISSDKYTLQSYKILPQTNNEAAS